MKKNILKTVSIAIIGIGFAVLFSGLVTFVTVNSALLFDTAVFCVIFFGIFVLGGISTFLLKFPSKSRGLRAIAISSVILDVILFTVTVVLAFAVDLFQPLALSVLSSVLLLSGLAVIIIGLIFALLIKINATKIIAAAVTLALLLSGGLIWANTQGYGEFYFEKETLFQNGECGYTTFRIPSLSVINKDVLNEKHGTTFRDDVLIAMAEGRKNSSRDLGEIDIVYKVSDDGGKSWTEVKKLISVKGESGKAGNPTVIFDEINGVINILYMLGTEKNGYNYITYNARAKIDETLNITVFDTVRITDEYDENAGTGKGDGVNKFTLMVGPGKGIQLTNGRMVAPCSNNGYSFAIFSDDYGKTWKRGKNACPGNECEIALLPDRLIMVSRDNIGTSDLHPKQYLRFVYSFDGGFSWEQPFVAESLKTPICMSSVTSFDGTLAVTFADDFYTRANLTLAYSTDGGKTFDKRRIYSGASGYSCAAFGAGKVYVLAEIGKVNYNEELAFFTINK